MKYNILIFVKYFKSDLSVLYKHFSLKELFFMQNFNAKGF